MVREYSDHSACWAPKLDAATLIRAAHLAQASDQGRLRDLIDAAVAKGGDDPNVLIGAYTLVLETGLGEREEEAHGWFRRALALSGPDGPVKQFELKDLLSAFAFWHTKILKNNVFQFELGVALPRCAFSTVANSRAFIRHTATNFFPLSGRKPLN